MEAARLTCVSVDEYLRGESAGDVRHEFVAGAIYATAGASEEHHDLARRSLEFAMGLEAVYQGVKV